MTDESKNLGGRPRAIPSPEEFDARVDAYVADCRSKGEPILLTGMILAIGLNSRASLDEYQNYDGFSNSVKRAKVIVETEYEKRLVNGTNGAAGPIFALKNFGWRDNKDVTLGNPAGETFKTELNLTADEAYKLMLEGR